VAEGSVLTAYGGVVAYKSMSNLQKNLQRLHASSEGPGGPPRGDKTAREIIQQEKKGSINNEFPKEWMDSTYNEILKEAQSGNKSAQKAKKLLDDKRFDKKDNRKK